jgi:transposase-like protein
MSGQVPTFDPDGLFTGSRSKLTDAERAEVVELAEAGYGRNEIARRTGIRQAAVSRITAAAGLGFGDRAKTAEAVRARVVQAQLRQLDQIDKQADLTDQAQVILAAVGAATSNGLDLNAYALAARAMRDVSTAKESLLRPLMAMWATDPAAIEEAFGAVDSFLAGLDAAAEGGFEPGQYGGVTIRGTTPYELEGGHVDPA